MFLFIIMNSSLKYSFPATFAPVQTKNAALIQENALGMSIIIILGGLF